MLNAKSSKKISKNIVCIHTKHFHHAHHQFPAGNAEQKLIADRPDQSLFDQKHLGQQVVIVERYGTVIVDDQSSTLIRNVLKTLDLVTVIDPALCVPHERNDLPGRMPVVACDGQKEEVLAISVHSQTITK